MTNRVKTPPVSKGIASADLDALAPENSGVGGSQDDIVARPAEFLSFGSTETTPAPRRNLGLLMDVSLEVVTELGRTVMPIKDVLGLTRGSIIELDKLAGEPVNVLVNGVLLARGEVVVVDEQFAVRITELVPVERRLGLLS